MIRTAHFVFLLFEEFSHIAFSRALEPRRLAGIVSGKPICRWSLISENGRTATCSNGSVTLVNGGMEPVRHADRLSLISGINVQNTVPPELPTFLRRERAAGTPLGAVCSAACILARAGFLDGMEAAIHREYHDLSRRNFPRCIASAMSSCRRRRSSPPRAARRRRTSCRT